jgi:hypothetical protein
MPSDYSVDKPWFAGNSEFRCNDARPSCNVIIIHKAT